jgi:PAS domain S-box-containing protein
MPFENTDHRFRITTPAGDIVIDTGPEKRFDRLTRIAAHTFTVPIALICLYDGQRIWLKSHQGLSDTTPASKLWPLCAVALAADGVTHIPDILAPHSAGHALDTSGDAQPIRFYAAVPINVAKQKIGALCIADVRARALSAADLAILHDLAGCVREEFKKIRKKYLAEQKQHLRAVLDTIVDGVLTTDSKGIIESANKAAETMFGYAAAEMLGHTVGMLMPEPFSSEHHSYFDNYRAAQQSKIIGIGRDLFGLHKNGDMFAINLAVGVLESADQTHFVGIVRNISGQKKNQQVLEKFKYALDHIVDSVFIGRVDTLQITYANESTTRYLGYSEAELLGMTLPELSAVYAKDMCQQLMAPLLADELNSLTIESWHRHKDGHLIPVEVTIQVLRQSKIRLSFLAIVRDTSERKALERMKDQFVSTVSHELRTPLTSIRGALGLVLGGALGDVPEKMRSILTMANRNGERLTLLINDLLDLEKIESEQMVFTFETIDLVQVVQQALEANQAYAGGYAINLQFYASAQPAWVNADAHRLLQVLANLLSNACKFSHRGGTVNVSVEVCGDHYKVLVLDFGSGIPEAFWPRVFERFAQADSADNRQKGGSGLGLSISKAIVERHRGSIGFDSIEGVGTSFFFTLPATTNKAVAGRPKQAGQQQEPKRPCFPLHNDGGPLPTLLHVEDDLDIIHLVKSLLGDTPVNYYAATTLAEARCFLELLAVNLLIMDLAMPDGSGATLLDTLDDSCKVMIFSAHDISEPIRRQVDAVLTKAATSNNQFLATICRVLNHANCRVASCTKTFNKIRHDPCDWKK